MPRAGTRVFERHESKGPFGRSQWRFIPLVARFNTSRSKTPT
jgi:hypothetical protein